MNLIPNTLPQPAQDLSALHAATRRRELRIRLCRAVSRLAGLDRDADNAVAIAHVTLALAELLEHCRKMADHARHNPGRWPRVVEGGEQ